MRRLLAAAVLFLSTRALGAPVPAENVVELPVANDPTVSFRIWFKVGSQDDPPGKEGLAWLTAAMLTEASTQRNSYEKIVDKLFPLAASYDSTAGMEMTVIHGRVHKDNLDDYYPLLLDAIVRPAFKAEDLERLRAERLSFIENTLRYASDEELGKAVLYDEIYAGTPYGHLGTGSIKSLKSITLDDLRKFHREHYTRDNVIIGIGGGQTPALVNKLRADLGALPAGTPPVAPKPAPKLAPGMRVTIVEKDTASTAISAGFPIGVVRGAREWYALAIANSWLGEHRNSSSHLYQVIRETRGLNYGDYSYIEHLPNGGRVGRAQPNAPRRSQIFEIWIRPVPNAARHFALRAALRELGNLAKNGMAVEPFERTRSFLRKYVLQYATTTMERLAWALDDRFYGVEGSHLERFRTLMGEITKDEVDSAVKKYLRSPSMQVVIVTKDAAALRDALVSGAASPITYESAKPPAVMAEDKEIASFPLQISAADVKIVKVEDLFQQ